MRGILTCIRFNGGPKLTDPSLDLSDILADSPENAPMKRVYANQNMDMADISLIGFDMDYTIAAYHQRPMDELAIQATIDKLIANCGYPEEIRNAELDLDFIIRGLVSTKKPATSSRWMRIGMLGAAIMATARLALISAPKHMAHAPCAWRQIGTIGLIRCSA